MGTKSKLAAVAAVLLLLALAGGVLVSDDGAPVPVADTADAPSPPTSRRDRHAAQDPPSSATASTSETPAAPVADVPIAPVEAADGRRRLSVTLLPPRDAKPLPAGWQRGTEEGRAPLVIEGGPARGSGPRFGGMSPTGSGTKWKRPPVRGSVVLSGRVDDLDGTPLPGATVYRVDLDAAGAVRSGVTSFQWIHEIGTTGDDGTFTFDAQPEGAWQLVANWHAGANRRRGLEIVDAVRIDAAPGASLAGLVLTAAVRKAQTTSITGSVVDDEGRPLGRTQVYVGYQEVWAGKDGRFDAHGVPLGDVTFRCRRTGYSEIEDTRPVTVGMAPVELRLAFGASGPLTLEGRVIDEDGLPVEGAPVFLGGTRDGSRWATTDTTGVFRFEKLPQLYATRGVRVMVTSPDPDRPGWFPAFEDGVTVPSPGLELVVQRTALLHVLVRDADTGAALPQFNLELKRDVLKDGQLQRVGFRQGTYWEDDGAVAIPVPKGTIVLFAEAPDHTPLHVSVEVTDVGTEMEVVLEMHAGDDGAGVAPK